MREWKNIAVITPMGDIDIASTPALREELDARILEGTRRILVNCQDVTFIDSTGLAFLLSRARRLAQRDGMLSLVGVSSDVARILEIARLLDVLHVSTAERPAIPALERGMSPIWSKTMNIAGDVGQLGYYRHRVVEMLGGVRLSREDCFDMALAVGEALGNAYDHTPGKDIVMEVSAYLDRVVVEVKDTGAGFELAPDELPEETEERGRGIRLMRLLVDRVDVELRRDVRGTVVRLTKLLQTRRS